MFWRSFVYILSPLRTTFRPIEQTIFLAADFQSRPFSTQQTTRPDHFPRSRPQTRPPTSQLISQLQICTERPTSRQSRSDRFLMGWVKGVNRNSSGWTLQRILSTHVRLEVPGLLFRLNLIVVRLVRGSFGMVRASPSLFQFRVALQVFDNDRSSAFSNEFRLQFGIYSSFRRMHFVAGSLGW